MKVFKWGFCFSVLSAVIIIGLIRLPASPSESAAAGESGSGDVILYVNGEPVTRQEFQLYLDKEKGAVTNYFSVKYQAGDSKDYWTTPAGGEQPIEMLKSRAAGEAAKGKLLQSLAVSKGIAVPARFEQLLEQWKDSNKQRKADISSNKAVFGLGQYDLNQYYFYTLSNLKLELEEVMGKGELKVTAEDVMQVYQAHAADYQHRTRLEIEELSAPYSGEVARSGALLAVQAALEQVNKGASPESISQGNPRLSLHRNTTVIDEGANPLSTEAVIIQTAMKLEKGSWSTVSDMGDSYSIVKLVDKNENYAVPIEEVESQLQAEALSLKFEDYFTAQLSKSEVKLEQGNYDGILAP